MRNSQLHPLLELTRGEIVESIHYGSIAVMDTHGTLIAWYGDPETVTFLRSTAKPFQAIPLIEYGGQAAYRLTSADIALICASHSGTEEHTLVVRKLQGKIGVAESDLLCGVHPPYHEPTFETMRQRGEQPTPNHNNCSGKHTGMLALARLRNWPTVDYLNPSHPIQQAIVQTFAEMCNLPIEQVHIGIDGCSAPNFAVPLRHAALAFARLCDPSSLPANRAAACQTITTAMTKFPYLVAGPGRFDTCFMEQTNGRILSKGGAEGYQGLGVLPGVLSPGSPAVGIAFKILDGDAKDRARPAVALEVLRQLGILSPDELTALSAFGPTLTSYNHRHIAIGQSRPCFQLEKG
ncbi:MAG TPA: asparaginase [Anaerolineales bacterium]|nr:asparaginase [Anaerolineales bacterium]